MIFQSFILDNLVYLCMKIMNSIVVVGLYYGFLTTFSIGPSYLFLLRARVMEEGTEKKVSATTGFITGQLMMFISIYYVPLHLTLGRPHTITVIALLYILFQFFANNRKKFLNYGYKNTNSIRNLSIQKIFFKNLIFQLLNPFFLPSSILIRLVNIYIFRCHNTFLFLISIFGGWLIGFIFFMKWFEFLFIWIQQKNSIKSNVFIPSNKYIMSEFRNSMSQIFLVSLFITCLYYLGKIPPPFFTNFTNTKLVEIQEREKIAKKKKMDVEINLQTARTKEKESTKQNLFADIFSKKEQDFYKFNKGKNQFGLVQKPLINILFNYKRWNRPFRYIKNNRFENIIKNECSELFFHTCESDGKEKISFTYPQNLSTFHKIIETKMDLFIRNKKFSDELSNYWNYTNEEKRKKLSNEFINRAKVLDNEFTPLDIFENRIRLCNDETKTQYLTKIYDPFLRGSFRGRIENCFSFLLKKEKTYKKNEIFINKLHSILLYKNYYAEIEQKLNIFDKKSLVNGFFFFYLINKFSKKSVSTIFYFEALNLFPKHNQEKFYCEEKKKKLFDAIRNVLNNKTIGNRKKCIGIKEITKKVPQWSYKFIDELEQLAGKNEAENYQIRSRKAKRVVLLNKDLLKKYRSNNTKDKQIDKNKNNELALIRYSQQPDFRRDIIKGSIRAQRRKTVTWSFFQRTVHSPLFLDKIEKSFFFFFYNFKSMKIFSILQNWIGKNTEFQIYNYTEDETTKESGKEEENKKEINEQKEQKRIEIAEAWDTIIFAQVIRGYLLITQSILRKYIILPSLIITKNIVRMIFFQFPEWSEDYQDWKKEMYIKCTYNGVQLSEKEFPQKWLTDGIQIKILFPFRLKPWHRSKLRSTEKEKYRKKKKNLKKKKFSFLTILGREVELPFSSPSKIRFSFFDPIFKKLQKKKKNFENFFFLVLKVLYDRTKLFLHMLKETAEWIIKTILFLTKKIKNNFNFLFVFIKLKKIDELNENKKNATIEKKNPMNLESTIPIQAINWKNDSLKKKKRKDLNIKTKTIIKQIKKMTKKEKKKGLLISEINIHSPKITHNTKRLELKKKILKILQRKNVRLIRKSYSFLKFFIKRVYIDIFSYIITIPKINIQLFIESTKIKKNCISNNEINPERSDKTNESIIQFISIIHKFYNTKNTNSENYCDVSFLSQAYVFFKLSQSEVINIYKLRSVFEYHERFLFLKHEIKNFFFEIQGIFHSKLKQKNFPNSVMNHWLKDCYQYDLSENIWSRLVPQKWRKRINQRHVNQNNDLTKCDLYNKNPFILYKEQQVGVLKIKEKIKKQYKYNLLSYNVINYVDNTHSYNCAYRSPFEENKKEKIFSNYNTHEKQFFNKIKKISNISIKHYTEKDAIIDIQKNKDRKYFEWRRIKIKILNRSISNPVFWLFSKFFIFQKTYRNNPWNIPTKLLFFHLNLNQNISENQKNITRTKRIIENFIPSKKKKSLEFELDTRNRGKIEYMSSENSESSLSNQEKDIQKNFVKSNSKKDNKSRKKKKNKMKVEVNLLLRKFLNVNLTSKDFLAPKILQNIKVYCLLVRLTNCREISIASIQRGELDLDIMIIQKFSSFRKKKNRKIKTLFLLEPLRLSIKNNKIFFLYQTIGISLIHKNKHKMNQRNLKKTNVDKKNFDKYITRIRNEKRIEKEEKKNYDLLIPENILSNRRRRELRILICLNPRSQNSTQNRKKNIYNENKSFQVLTKKRKDLTLEKKKLMNLKIFLWPNYRFEDLACINRYWFNTHNGSRFSILRIHMYPRF